ncbi:unnamed protein product [Prorocentrum cordatum]|uniref:Uncharacterized protein n=1 Tax=Prorocentrum cordatum TaxID=2364126 RepID=A0ABN9TQQ5_9DINO|nr:unnamed protein product [Polarella glacialis]
MRQPRSRFGLAGSRESAAQAASARACPLRGRARSPAPAAAMGGSRGADARCERIARCVADIREADLVSLDLEFSGLFLDADRPSRKQPLSMEGYFAKCANSVAEFLPLQLGVCCARQRPSDGVWEMRPHELNLHPAKRRVFASDFQSLLFLRGHGFDFNAFLDSGHPVGRLPARGSEGRGRRGLGPAQASQVVQALRDAGTPLVVHNGFLDVLHVYGSFVGRIPDALPAFCEAWLSQFPLLFDTRLIATEGRYTVLQGAGGSIALEPAPPALGRPARGLGCRALRARRRPAARGQDGGPRLLGLRRAADRGGLPAGDGAVAAVRGGRVHPQAAQETKGTPPGDRGRAGPARLAGRAPVRRRARREHISRGHRRAGPRRRERRRPPQRGHPRRHCRHALRQGGRRRTGRRPRGWSRPRWQEAAGGEEPTGIVSPSALREAKACRRFHNRLAIVGASPGPRQPSKNVDQLEH